MKKIILIALCACAVTAIYAQDVIYRRSGTRINAVVIEIGENDISYKSFSNKSGPTYRIKQSEVIKIKYENGDEDLFDEGDEVIEEEVVVSTAPQRRQAATRNTGYTQPRQQPARQQPASRNTYRNDVYTERSLYDEPPRYRKSYVGFAVGAALPLDSYASDVVGSQVNLNFGYLFTRRIGIAATVYTTSYELKYSTNTYSGLLAGPIFAFGPASGNFSFDLRPGIGYSGYASEFAGGLGMSLRWGCGRYISMSANWDFYFGPESEYDSTQLTLGLNVRLP